MIQEVSFQKSRTMNIPVLRCRSRRRGYSLIEVVVATTLVTGVLALVIMFIRSIHTAERDLRNEVLLQRSIAQLAPQLRTDIRQAALAKVTENKSGELRLLRENENETVVYLIGDGFIERTTENPASRRRETYALPGNWQSRWEVDEQTTRLVLMLAMQRNNKFASPLRHVEVAAALGRDASCTLFDTTVASSKPRENASP